MSKLAEQVTWKKRHFKSLPARILEMKHIMSPVPSPPAGGHTDPAPDMLQPQSKTLFKVFFEIIIY